MIILATNNKGKVSEFNDLLAGKSLQIISQGELNISEIEETGLTFVENAILKARHASACANLPAIADDSGLIVDVLNGAPGIYSARYASENYQQKTRSFSDNVAKLLFELRDVPVEQRGAYFYCAIVYLRHAKDPAPLICCGVWEGRILSAPCGKNGFGYDPIFWVPTHDCSAAELTSEIKNKISHRGQAMSVLMEKLL